MWDRAQTKVIKSVHVEFGIYSVFSSILAHSATAKLGFPFFATVCFSRHQTL